jgi:hypothetical protein
MIIGSFGSVGMGLVWGWLLVLAGGSGSSRRRVRSIIVFVLATILIATQLYSFAGGQRLQHFLVSAVISLLLHLAWRRALLTASAEMG